MRCSPMDKEEVTRILSDRTVFPNMCDDGSNNINMINKYINAVLNNIGAYVLKPAEDTIFMFLPLNSFTFDVHTAVVKGPARVSAAKEAIRAVEWMCDNTRVEKFITQVPVFNKPAVFFARYIGMKKEGRLTKMFKKDGKMHDVLLFGATRQDVENNRKEK